MRVDLWDDPRIIRIQSALQTDKAQICGALFRTWSLADQYTEDGRLAGYTIEALDNAVGIAGWSKALQAAGWLAVENDAVTVPRFDEHNGQSAKRRIMERERKRRGRDESAVRKPSASRADKKRPREEKSERTEAGESDGAMCLYFEEEIQEFRRLANSIAHVVRPDTPGRPLIAKVAILVSTGALAENDLHEALESFKTKTPEKPTAWFKTCIENKLSGGRTELNRMLASVEVPAELLNRGKTN